MLTSKVQYAISIMDFLSYSELYFQNTQCKLPMLLQQRDSLLKVGLRHLLQRKDFGLHIKV